MNNRERKSAFTAVVYGGFLPWFQLKSLWPTIWVDLLSNIHLYIVWSLYVFDYDCVYKRRTRSNLVQSITSQWPQIDYMERVSESPFNKILFVVWTLQVLATVNIVHYHLTTPHHPKFYVGRLNRIAIVCHIIGGIIADFGGYLGFILGNQAIIKIASGAGILLHVPSAFWQSRNLYGRREVNQPLYYFTNSFLLLKYIDVWFENGSFVSIVAMGYAVNIFALVRVYHKMIMQLGMALDTAYDISILFATVSNFPIALGPTGCIQLISSVFMWNFVFESLMPEQRSLLQVNRTFADVFPDKFKGKSVDFLGTFRKYRAIYNDERIAVARASFHIIAGDNNLIDLDELEELFECWGLPDAKIRAKQVFKDTDLDGDGVIDFDEFTEKLWFIWERIYVIGESEKVEGVLQKNQIWDRKSYCKMD